MNVQYTALSPHGWQEAFHLSIVQIPYCGWDGITQDRPRTRCQRIVRLKRAALIPVFTDSVKRFLTMHFSSTKDSLWEESSTVH